MTLRLQRTLARGTAFALLALSLGCGKPPSPLAGPDAPGILLIVVDTLRADHLGSYGYDRPTSPRLDALAADGTLFEAAIAQASFSGPSYATILTGRLPQEHGVRDHPRLLAAENTTLAEAAREQGLKTAGFISHPFLATEWKYDQGFDDYRLLEPPAGATAPVGRIEDVVDAALGWLEELPTTEPFLLFVQVMEPHMPYSPPPPLDTAFGPVPEGYRLMEEVITSQGQHAPIMFGFDEQGYTPSDLQRTIDLYDGTIAQVDAEVGRLIDALEQAGRLDRTLIAVTADHGEMLGEQGLHFHHDMSLYDPVIRVPLILRYPPVVPAARRVETQVRLLDLAPSLLDILQLEGPEGASGRSVRSLFAAEGRDRPAFAENQPFIEARAGYPNYRMEVPGNAGKWRMVRTGDAKLIYIPTADGLQEEVYVLDQDPGETDNALGRSPETDRLLRGLLDRHLAADDGLEGSPDAAPLDAETLEELRALGYIG